MCTTAAILAINRNGYGVMAIKAKGRSKVIRCVNVEMNDRTVVAFGAMFGAAIFAFAAGGNFLVFLALASMAILGTWDFG